MDAQTAAEGLAGLYHVLSDLGGLIAGLLALLAGLLAYAAGRHQARIVRAAAEAQIAALRDQVKQLQLDRDAEFNRRREDLRFALACEATRVAEQVAHRYRVIPVEYGAGRLETIARSACDVFKVEPPAVLRNGTGASQLLDKEAIAAASLLAEALEEVNSLLAVEGALGRLPAVELMAAYENATEAAKRLRSLTANNGAEPVLHPPRRVADLIGTAAQ